MMKAYIAITFSRFNLMEKQLSVISETLQQFDIESFVFVKSYSFDSTQEQIMMQQVMSDIEKCDLLIAETSEKGIGIGVEVGFAKAKGKPVIYLRQKEAEHSTTIAGISDFQVIYINENDLGKQLFLILRKILNRLN